MIISRSLIKRSAVICALVCVYLRAYYIQWISENKETQPADKPGSVPGAGWRRVSAIYLILPSPASSSGLPLSIGRAALHTLIYMTLQPIRRTAPLVAKRDGELLPRLFTLTGGSPLRRFFSVTLLKPCGLLPVRKYGALCCPDFPHASRRRRAADWRTARVQRYAFF